MRILARTRDPRRRVRVAVRLVGILSALAVGDVEVRRPCRCADSEVRQSADVFAVIEHDVGGAGVGGGARQRRRAVAAIEQSFGVADVSVHPHDRHRPHVQGRRTFHVARPWGTGEARRAAAVTACALAGRRGGSDRREPEHDAEHRCDTDRAHAQRRRAQPPTRSAALLIANMIALLSSGGKTTRST